MDLSKVPANPGHANLLLSKAANQKSSNAKELNRRLIFAGNSSGIKLNSGFFPGVTEGGTKLIIEASHKYISGTVEFNNFQSEQLALSRFKHFYSFCFQFRRDLNNVWLSSTNR